METDRPADYSKWPVEIRKLYDASIRAAEASHLDALAAAFDQLDDLTERSEDQMLAHTACGALLQLMTRIFAEEAAAHYFGDGGQAAIGLATRILSSSADATAREKATKLLEVVMSKLPPKSRA